MTPREHAVWSGFLVAAAVAVGGSLFATQKRSPIDAAISTKGPDVGEPAADALPAADSTRPLHVLLIVVDSLRADMPWMGYDRPIAPFLTAFAASSVTYTRAYSISSSTARSVGPLLVGRYPSEMERNDLFFTRYYPSNEFVSERLSAAGHHTAALTTHMYFTRGASGLEQGFDDYVVIRGKREAAANEADKPARRTTERARKMMQDAVARLTGDGRFFAYVHYIDPHAPYRSHQGRPTWGTRLRDLYDQEVHYTDEWIGNLVDWARAQPWGKSLAVIVTADHGEGMGEHGHYKHGYELWEELTRVPLIVHVPDVTARRIDLPRSQIDLAPTVLELMGVARSSDHSGVSLVPEIRGEAPKSRTVVLDLPADDLQQQRRGVIEGNLKLIVSGKDQRTALFDLGVDPEERNNLAPVDDARHRQMLALHARINEKLASGKVHRSAPKSSPPH